MQTAKQFFAVVSDNTVGIRIRVICNISGLCDPLCFSSNRCIGVLRSPLSPAADLYFSISAPLTKAILIPPPRQRAPNSALARRTKSVSKFSIRHELSAVLRLLGRRPCYVFQCCPEASAHETYVNRRTSFIAIIVLASDVLTRRHDLCSLFKRLITEPWEHVMYFGVGAYLGGQIEGYVLYYESHWTMTTLGRHFLLSSHLHFLLMANEQTS